MIASDWEESNVPLFAGLTFTVGVRRDGAAVTVTPIVVDAVKLPEVPVMVTVSGPPITAVPEAVRVRTLEFAVAGLGLKLAVTPFGRPVTENVTLPVNPLAGVKVMVFVMLPPSTRLTEFD
jgi:hypothetical protein